MRTWLRKGLATKYQRGGGVPHSLIRHHFGSKEQIWYAVSDTLHIYMLNYLNELIKTIPEDRPANLALYNFVMRMFAHMLLVPYAVQFAADAVRQESEFFDYFIDKSGRFEAVIQELVDKHNADNPQHSVHMWELKWQIIYAAHGAISMKPVMDQVWPEQAGNHEQLLLNHWELFNKSLASQLSVTEAEMMHPKTLEELLLPIACDFSLSGCGEHS